MLLEIKDIISNLKGKKITILVDVGRNKLEEYTGVIEDTYKNIWTFRTDDNLKSFTYSDILIKNVIISS